MSSRSLTCVLALCCVSLSGCSDSASHGAQGESARAVARPAAPYPVVLETFAVGDDVVVRSLAMEAERDRLWVGTSAGVLEIDLTTGRPANVFTRKDGLANEYIFAIAVDSQGYKWLGTNAGGVSRYRDGQWRTFFPMHGLADYWVYAFAEQPGGKLWIGTWNGANRLSLDTLAFETFRTELVNEWVYGLAVDREDRVWLGTEGGLSMFDGRQWRHWTHADGLGAPNEAGLPISPNTGLGTRSRHDLSVLVQGRESYNPNYVFAVHAAPDGTLWVGTWGGGVGHFDGSRWSNYTTRDGLAGNIVYSVAEDSEGNLWLGTNHGVSRYDGRSFHNYGRNEGLPGDHVYALAGGRDGEMWLGTTGGVAHLGFPRPAQPR